MKKGRAALKEAIAEMKAGLPKKKGRSKYGAIRTQRHGIWFDSKGEADRYDELLLLKAAGRVHMLRRQVSFYLQVKEAHIADYVADFTYYDDDLPGFVVEDFKGHRTPEYRLKKKLFEALYAPLKITETGKSSKRLTRRKRVSK